MKKLLLALMIFVFAATANAADVTLAWDPVVAGDLAGYKLFYRTEGVAYDYAAPIWTGTETTATVTVPGDGYFVCRSYDTSGNESIDSNEVFDGRHDSPPAPGSLYINMSVNVMINLGETK
jgi:hypothetical protein